MGAMNGRIEDTRNPQQYQPPPPQQQQGYYPPPQQQQYGYYPPQQQQQPQPYYPPPPQQQQQPHYYNHQPQQYPPQQQGGYYQQTSPHPPSNNRSQPNQAQRTMADGATGDPAEFENVFDDKRIRRAFIRKVYTLISIQLLITAAITVPFFVVPVLKNFLRDHSFLVWIAMGVYMFCYFAIVCCSSVARKTPGNYICLFTLTVALSFVCAFITGAYSTESVLIALGITLLVTVSLTIFACQTKIDFTLCWGLALALCIALLVTGLVVMVLCMIGLCSRWLMGIYGGIAALIYSFFLVYDTQLVVGKNRYRLTEEEYVYGAVQIYVDIINLFLSILTLTGAANDG